MVAFRHFIALSLLSVLVLEVNGWVANSAIRSSVSLRLMNFEEELFEGEEDEMFPIADNYVHAKYKAVSESNDHEFCTADDAREILYSILPPVTKDELEEEVTQTLENIMKKPGNSKDKIDEEDFVKAIVQNRYWRKAGSLVVKELMYFDALYTYYQSGSPLLNNDDYETLKENLTWEGSSVATMNAKEAMFVTAVASARRGEPVMDDDEYTAIKAELKKKGSWVTNRSPDALEKLGLNTFMGYLHRSLV